MLDYFDVHRQNRDGNNLGSGMVSATKEGLIHRESEVELNIFNVQLYGVTIRMKSRRAAVIPVVSTLPVLCLLTLGR